MLLSKDAILAANDLTNESVDVPEWGGSVLVRSMTGADRDIFEQSMVKVGKDGTRTPDLNNMRAKLIAMTLVDEAGNRLFSSDEVDLLALKSAAALDRVFAVAQRVNGLGEKQQDDAVKN